MRKYGATLVAAASAGLVTLGAGHVRADSGRLNLHIDLGTGGAVAGDGTRSGGSGDASVGGMALVQLDWQLRAPFALELIAGGGGFARPVPTSTRSGAAYALYGIGARFRFLDDTQGYANERRGNANGNAFVAAHIGLHNFDGRQFGLDVSGGYEWSVHEPVSVGAFVRGMLAFAGDSPETDFVLLAGVTLSFEIVGPGRSHDADRDGLDDGEEAELGTDPNHADSDRDGIPDGLEVETGTNPRDEDTDSDGLRDGREDRDLDGELDDGETDPRVMDTDRGGVSDFDEVVTYRTNPRDPADDDLDGDGVANPFDTCPDTPRGSTVNGVGCPTAGSGPAHAGAASIVITGVEFADDRSRPLASSDPALQIVARRLESSHDRFEIVVFAPAGDETVGGVGLAQRRAEAIALWFVQHGIARDRLVPRGYGGSAAPSEGGNGSTHSVRIELRRLR